MKGKTMKNNFTTLTTIFIILLTVLVSGCEGLKGPEGPAGPPGPEGKTLVYVVGGVESPTEWDSTGDAYVIVLNSPTIADVKINNIPIPFRGIFEYANDNFPIRANDSAKLVVSFTKLDNTPGTARSNIKLPGNFAITSHDTSDTAVVRIQFNQPLTFTWSSSAGVEFYQIYFYLSYSYIDTAGNWRSYYFSIDSSIINTSITFPKSQLFPNANQIGTIHYSYGYFYISAMKGPYQAGQHGNVTGDGIGFFYGNTFGNELLVKIQGTFSKTTKNEIPCNTFEEFLRKKAEELKSKK